MAILERVPLYCFVTFVAFIISAVLMPFTIAFLRRMKLGQSIRVLGPEAHQQKEGTPTMGGITILIATVVATVGFYGYFFMTSRGVHATNLHFILFATLGYGVIGFLDDYIKLVKQRNLGLTSKQKFIGQLIIGFVLFWVLLAVRGDAIFSLKIPWTEIVFNITWLYLPLLIFILVGAANAVNLTDGLDGLVAGTAICAYLAYAIIGLKQGKIEVVIFSLAIVGSLLGFLLFNACPARLFMGDVGSLALGGGLAALAIVTQTEFLLVIIAGVFVIETISVILQVASFKLRGKRIFRMSPIHHHFELIGFSEWQVVVLFWGAAAIFALAGVFLYPYFTHFA